VSARADVAVPSIAIFPSGFCTGRHAAGGLSQPYHKCVTHLCRRLIYSLPFICVWIFLPKLDILAVEKVVYVKIVMASNLKSR
jgi:hypothetical protein